MCNEQANRVAAGLIRDDIQDLRIPLRFPGGRAEPRTARQHPHHRPQRDRAQRRPEPGACRAGRCGGGAGRARMASRCIISVRRAATLREPTRCLIVADAFYEFTDPPADPAVPKKGRRKDKWAFTKAGEAWFMIAGHLARRMPKSGEAYTMLTCEPGPDVAPYHSRQIVVIERRDWAMWLDPAAPARRKLTAPVACRHLRGQLRPSGRRRPSPDRWLATTCATTPCISSWRCWIGAAGVADHDRDRIAAAVGRDQQADVVVARGAAEQVLAGAGLVPEAPPRRHRAAHPVLAGLRRFHRRIR